MPPVTYTPLELIVTLPFIVSAPLGSSELTYTAQLLRLSVVLPLRPRSTTLLRLRARTQPELTRPRATARAAIVGPDVRNSDDSIGVCGWLMIASTASLSVV